MLLASSAFRVASFCAIDPAAGAHGRYEYLKAKDTLTEEQAAAYANELLRTYKCTLLDAASLNDPYAYQNLLCADGWVFTGTRSAKIAVTLSIFRYR